MTDLGWDLGEWLNPPVSAVGEGADLLVTAAPESDLWQGTYYGFTLRASWSLHALILRARADGARRMLRLASFGVAAATAGPYCCAPERDGLTVRFTGWRRTGADPALHLD